MRISDGSSDVCSSDLLRPSRLRWGAIPAAVFLALIDNIRCHSYNSIGFRYWRKLQKLCRAARRTFRVASLHFQIGRASCRERVCQYVYNSVVDVALTKKALESQEETALHRLEM